MTSNYFKMEKKKLKQTLLMAVLVTFAYSSLLSPDKSLPFYISTPNQQIGETLYKYNFRFSLSGVPAITAGNVFTAQFNGLNVNYMVTSPICSLAAKKNSQTESIDLSPNSFGNNSVGCEFTRAAPLNIDEFTRLDLAFEFPQPLNAAFIYKTQLFISTSADLSTAVIIGESPFFSAAAIYNELPKNSNVYATLNSFRGTSTTGCIGGSSTCSGIYPDATFDLDISFTASMKIDLSTEILILFEYTGNITPTDKLLGQSNTDGFSVSVYKNNAIQLNFTQDILPSTVISLKIKNLQASSVLESIKANLNFYWKNTFSRIFVLDLTEIKIIPYPISYTPTQTDVDWQGIAHPEFQDIYENGAWPIKFIADIPPLKNGGYLKIDNIASTQSIFAFIPTTCDFSENVPGNSLFTLDQGKRSSCYSSYQTTEDDSGNPISSFFVRLGKSDKVQTISLTVWGVAVKCSTNDLFNINPVIRNIMQSDNINQYVFKYMIYRTVNLLAADLFDSTQLYATSNNITMYGNCLGSFITHFNSFPEADTLPWNKDTNYVSENPKKDVLLYSEIHDWNLTQKSTVDKQINYIEKTNSLFIGDITDDIDIEFGGFSNNFNHFPLPTVQGTISLQLSRNFLSPGSADCYLKWYNNGQQSTASTSGSNLITTSSTITEPTQKIDLTNSILNDPLTYNPLNYSKPIVIQSNQLSTNDDDGKSKFFRSSDIDLSLGFYTNCYKLKRLNTVKWIYSYIDFTYIHKREGITNRVGRFVKLFPSGQVFNNPDSKINVNASHSLLYAVSAGKARDDVCILTIGNIFSSSQSTFNSLNIHIQNLTFLDLDYTSLSSSYPNINLLASNQFSSLLTPFSHRSTNQGELNTPRKDCSIYDSDNDVNDDSNFCGCSSFNPHPTCKLRCSINQFHPRCFCNTQSPDETCPIDCATNFYHPLCKCQTLNPHLTCPINCQLNYFARFSKCNCYGLLPDVSCPVNCRINSKHPSCACDSISPHVTCPVYCINNINHPLCLCNDMTNYHYTCPDVDCSANANYPKCNCLGNFPNANCPINCITNPKHKSCKCDILRYGAPHVTCTINCTLNPFHPSCNCQDLDSVSNLIPNLTCPINCSMNADHPICLCQTNSPHITCPVKCDVNIHHELCYCNSITEKPHISCPVANCNVDASIRHPLCHCNEQNTTNSIFPNSTCQVSCIDNPYHPSCNCWIVNNLISVNSTCPINCKINPKNPNCNCGGANPHFTCTLDCSVNNNHPGCECAYTASDIFRNSYCPIDCIADSHDTRCKCESTTPHSSCAINCKSNINHPACDCSGSSPHGTCPINCHSTGNPNHPACQCGSASPNITCDKNCATNGNHPLCFCSYYPNVTCNVNCQLNPLHPSCNCFVSNSNGTPHPSCTPMCYLNSNHQDCHCLNTNPFSLGPNSSCKVDCTNSSILHPSCQCNSNSPHITCPKNSCGNQHHPLCNCYSTTLVPDINCSINCITNNLHPFCQCKSTAPHISCPLNCSTFNINHPSCQCESISPHPTCPILCSANPSHQSCNCSSITPHITCSPLCSSNPNHPLCNCSSISLVPFSTCAINCSISQNWNDCHCESRNSGTPPHVTCPINCTHNSYHPSCNCNNANFSLRHDTCPYNCSNSADLNNPKCTCGSQATSLDVTCPLNCQSNNRHPNCYCNRVDKIPSIYCVPQCSINSKHQSCICNSNNPLSPPHITCPIDCKKNSLHPSCMCGTINQNSSCSLNCNTNPDNVSCGCPGGKLDCSINCSANPSHPYCFCSLASYFQSVNCSINCSLYPNHPNCNCNSTVSTIKPNVTCPVNCAYNDNHPSCNCYTNNINLYAIHPTCPVQCNLYPNHPSCNCDSQNPNITCTVDCKTNYFHPLCNCNSTDGSMNSLCPINCTINNTHPLCYCTSSNADFLPNASCPINCLINDLHPNCQCSSITPNQTCPINCLFNAHHEACNCDGILAAPHFTCSMNCSAIPSHPNCNCLASSNVNINCVPNCVVNTNHPMCNCDSSNLNFLPHSSCTINCASNPLHPLCYCDSIYDLSPHPTCIPNCQINQYHPICKCNTTTPHITCIKDCLSNNYHPSCYCYNNDGQPDPSCAPNCSLNDRHIDCNCSGTTPNPTCTKNCVTNGLHPLCNCNGNAGLPVDSSCPIRCNQVPQHPLCNCNGLNPNDTCTVNCSVNYYHIACNCFINLFTPNINCPVNCSFNSNHPNCNCSSATPDSSCPINCTTNSNHPYCFCSSISPALKPHYTCSIDCSINNNHPNCDCDGTSPHQTCPLNNCTNQYHPLCNCFQVNQVPNSNCPVMCDIYSLHPSCHCTSSITTSLPNINCMVNCSTLSILHPLCGCDGTAPHQTCPINCNNNSNHYACDCLGTNPHPTCFGGSCDSRNYNLAACNCKSTNLLVTPNSNCPPRCDINLNHVSCKCGSSTPDPTCNVNCINNSNHPYCDCANNPHVTCPINCSDISSHPTCECNSSTPHITCPMNCGANPNHPNCHCDGVLIIPDSGCDVNCKKVSNHPNCNCGAINPDISCDINCAINQNHPNCNCDNNPLYANFPHSSCNINCSINNSHPNCKCDSVTDAHQTCNESCSSFPYQPYCNCFGAAGTPNSNCPVNCRINSNHVSCNCNFLESRHVTCPKDCTIDPLRSDCDCSGSSPDITCAVNCSVNSNHPVCNCNTSNSDSTCVLDCANKPYQNGCYCYSTNVSFPPNSNCFINCSSYPNHPSCRCADLSPHVSCPINCIANINHPLCYCNSTDNLLAPHKTCAINCSNYPNHPDCKCDIQILGAPHSTCPVDCTANSYHPNCNCYTNDSVPHVDCPFICGLYYRHPTCNCYSDQTNIINAECPVDCQINANHPYCNCKALPTDNVKPHETCNIECNTYPTHPLCDCLGFNPHFTCPVDCSTNYRHQNCYCNKTLFTDPTPSLYCPIDCQVNSRHPLCNCGSIDTNVQPNVTCPINCAVNANHPKCNCLGLLNFQVHSSCLINCAASPLHVECRCNTINPNVSCPMNCLNNIYHPSCNCFSNVLVPNVNCPVRCSYNSRHPKCNCGSLIATLKPDSSCSINCLINSNHPLCYCSSTALIRPHFTCLIDCTKNSYNITCNCNGKNPHITCPMNCLTNNYHPSCNCYSRTLVQDINCPINCSFNSLHPSCKCQVNVRGVPHVTCPINCVTNPFHPLCACSWSSSPNASCIADCYVNPFHPVCNCLGLVPHISCPINCYINANHQNCKCNTLLFAHKTCPPSSDCDTNSFSTGCSCQNVTYTNKSNCSSEYKVNSVLKNMQSYRQKSALKLYTYFTTIIKLSDISSGSVTSADMIQPDLIFPVICPKNGNNRNFLIPSVTAYTYQSDSDILSYGFKYYSNSVSSNINSTEYFLTNALNPTKIVQQEYTPRFTSYGNTTGDDMNYLKIYGANQRPCNSISSLLSSEVQVSSQISLDEISSMISSPNTFYFNKVKYSSFLFTRFTLGKTFPIDGTTSYKGLTKPLITSLATSRVSFNCYSNDGNLYTDLNNESLGLDLDTLNPWGISITKGVNTPYIYKEDKSFTVDIQVDVQSQLPTGSSLILDTNLVSASSLCSVDNSKDITVAFADACQIQQGKITCPVANSSISPITSIKICCHNVPLNKKQVVFSSTSSISNSSYLFSKFRDDQILDLMPTYDSEATKEILIPKIKSYSFSQVNQANGLGEVFITIDLGKPAFPNQAIRIQGIFTPILIQQNIPECSFAYNKNAGANFNFNVITNEDLMVDRCLVFRDTTNVMRIDLYNKSKIFKCGMLQSSTVVIRLAPIYINNLAVTNSQYSIVTSLGNFDSTNYVSATPTNQVFPSVIFPQDMITVTNIDKLCEVDSVFPNILGFKSSIVFRFDLSSIQNSSVLINEASIYFKKIYYNLTKEKMYCFLENVLTPCVFKDSGFLQIFFPQGLPINKISLITVRNVSSGENGAHSFDCSVSNYDSYSDKRQNILVGKGVNSYKVLTPTSNGILLNNNASMDSSKPATTPRTKSDLVFDFLIDNTYNYQILPIDFTSSISNPGILIELPPEYPLPYFNSFTLTPLVIQIPEAIEDQDIVFKVKSTRIEGSTILITLDTNKITFDPNYNTLSVKLPVINTPFIEVQTGIIKISVLNDVTSPTKIFSNNNNLNAYTPSIMNEPFKEFTRGFAYSYPQINAGKPTQFADIVDGSLINSALLYQGRYKQIVAKFAQTIFPQDYEINFQLENNSIFKILSDSVTLNNKNSSTQFYLGSPCGLLPGVYLASFISTITYNNVAGVGPILVSVSPLTTSFESISFSYLIGGSSTSNFNMSPGGRFKVFIIAGSIPFESLAFTVTYASSNNSKSVIESDIPSIINSTNTSFIFKIQDPTVSTTQQLSLLVSGKCFKFDSNDYTTTLSFSPSIPLTKINNIDIYSLFSYNTQANSPLNSLSINVKGVANTDLFCSLFCASANGPSVAQMLSRTTLSDNQTNKDIFISFLNDNVVTISFNGLLRNQSYKLKCALSDRGAVPNTIDTIFTNMNSTFPIPSSNSNISTVALATTPSVESKSFNLITTNPISNSVTQALVRSLQLAYIDRGIYITDSNGFSVMNVQRPTKPQCYDEGATNSIRLLQTATATTGTTTNSNYYIIIEESFDSNKNLTDSLGSISSILSSSSKINDAIAQYTTEQLTQNPIVTSFIDYYIDSSLLIVSNNPLAYNSPNTVLTIKYPSLTKLTSLTCNWKAVSTNEASLTNDVIKTCTPSTVNISTYCGKFTITSTTTSVNMPTGNLPSGTYNFHILCQNSQPFSKYSINKNVGKLAYVPDVFPDTQSSVSVTSTNSSMVALGLLSIILTILLLA